MMMRKLLYKAAALTVLCLAALSCGKSNKDSETKSLKVTGSWVLSRVETKAPTVGDVPVEIYIDFASGSAFTLYQKLGEGKFTKFTGTYTVSGKELSGSYTGGSAWGPYEMELSEDQLVLSKADGVERDVYSKIDAIPTTVLSNVY